MIINNKFRIGMLLTAAMTLVACGGGSSDSGQSNEVGLVEPSEPTTVLVHDGFSTTNDGNGAFSVVNVSSQESVSYFEVTETTQIQKIEWLGIARGITQNMESATFILRVYEGEQWPAQTHTLELIEQASFSEGRRHNGSIVYHFVLEADNLMTLDAGHYWLSVLDPLTEMIDFRWEWEPFINSYRGLGGAVRTLNPTGEWAASLDNPRTDEGNMLRITGLTGI